MDSVWTQIKIAALSTTIKVKYCYYYFLENM